MAQPVRQWIVALRATRLRDGGGRDGSRRAWCSCTPWASCGPWAWVIAPLHSPKEWRWSMTPVLLGALSRELILDHRHESLRPRRLRAHRTHRFPGELDRPAFDLGERVSGGACLADIRAPRTTRA